MKKRLFLWMIIVSVTATTAQVSLAQDAASTDALVEIRNYHFNPDLIEEYRSWVEDDALPYISRHMDVVGFWVGNAGTPEIRGPRVRRTGFRKRNLDYPLAEYGRAQRRYCDGVFRRGMGGHLLTRTRWS